jgi:hypothetical protein
MTCTEEHPYPITHDSLMDKYRLIPNPELRCNSDPNILQQEDLYTSPNHHCYCCLLLRLQSLPLTKPLLLRL